jgi:hypothetical protein
MVEAKTDKAEAAHMKEREEKHQILLKMKMKARLLSTEMKDRYWFRKLKMR